VAAVLRGRTDAELARARGISARTVPDAAIFAKVGAKSRGELRAKSLGP